MKIKLNWLLDYLGTKDPLDPQKISDALCACGLEVDGCQDTLKHSQDFYLAQLEAIDKENSCFQILLGKEKHKVKSNFLSHIKVGDYLGVFKPEGDTWCVALWSHLHELGEDQPIFIPKEDLSAFEQKPQRLKDLPQFNDSVLELSVTPNRSDALSHLGVSREVSAFLDIDKKSPMSTVREMGGPAHEKISVDITNDLGIRYACRIIENIEVGPSPWWLKIRLLACGIKPLNNVVDVTNYVMMARGQPMHAFDYKKLKSVSDRVKIEVRAAKPGETFVSLDNKKLSLLSTDLVIADNNGPIALAGVIGGNDSKVDEKTTAVVLESACFCPVSVRKTAKAHGITTESSVRFERGVDPNGTIEALNYAARLLVEMGGVSRRDTVDVYKSRVEPEEVMMRPEKARKILGFSREDFDQDLLRNKLVKLGIETVAKRGEAIYFRIPSFRPDITREIDMIEEAGRVIGLDKIKPSSQRSFSYQNENLFFNTSLGKIQQQWQNYLVSRGFFQAINYSFTSDDNFFSITSKDNESSPIYLKKPLSENHKVMRVSLIPSLLGNLEHNLRNQESSIRLFEFGRTYKEMDSSKAYTPSPEGLSNAIDSDAFAVEEDYLAGVMNGKDILKGYGAPAAESNFSTLKGIVQEGLEVAGFSYSIFTQSLFFSRCQKNIFHPSNSLSVSCLSKDGSEKVLVGHFGELHPDLTQNFTTTKQIYLFEINLSVMSKIVIDSKSFKPFSRFPSMKRDLAVLIDTGTPARKLVQLCKKLKQTDLLSDVEIFDIYESKKLPDGKKSVALSFTFTPINKTLTDIEAQSLINEYIDLATKEYGAIVRV